MQNTDGGDTSGNSKEDEKLNKGQNTENTQRTDCMTNISPAKHFFGWKKENFTFPTDHRCDRGQKRCEI